MGGGQAHTESSSKDSNLLEIKHQHPVERQIHQLNLAEGCFYKCGCDQVQNCSVINSLL